MQFRARVEEHVGSVKVSILYLELTAPNPNRVTFHLVLLLLLVVVVLVLLVVVVLG
jgi:hypothetical protein